MNDPEFYEGLQEFVQSEGMTHAIVVYEGDEIVHICTYESPVTAADVNDLIEELNTDKEFDLIGKANSLEYKAKEITDSNYPWDWKECSFEQLN